MNNQIKKHVTLVHGQKINCCSLAMTFCAKGLIRDDNGRLSEINSGFFSVILFISFNINYACSHIQCYQKEPYVPGS